MCSGLRFAATAKGDDMNRKMMMMAVLGCAGACACAGLARNQRQEPIELLDVNGLSAPALSVKSGGAIRFVNGDGKPHQIYSPDCPELASTPLGPGQAYTATLSAGPKVCHFQDLLALLAPAYSGTVDVQEPPQGPAGDFTGTE
jgi:hypothetical protein